MYALTLPRNLLTEYKCLKIKRKPTIKYSSSPGHKGIFPHRVEFPKPYVTIQRQHTRATVQPVPTPCSTKLLASSSPNAGGSNQKLMLFRRGNAISGAPMSKGTKMLPYPPM